MGNKGLRTNSGNFKTNDFCSNRIKYIVWKNNTGNRFGGGTGRHKLFPYHFDQRIDYSILKSS